jgi:hypothetical protein
VLDHVALLVCAGPQFTIVPWLLGGVASTDAIKEGLVHLTPPP